MVSPFELEVGRPRLLDVDNLAILPVNLSVRVVVTSSDVLHS